VDEGVPVGLLVTLDVAVTDFVVEEDVE